LTPAMHFVVLGLLCLLPCPALLISIDSNESFLRTHLLRIPVVFWALWAMLSVWAALDMPRISKLFWPQHPSPGPAGDWVRHIGAHELHFRSAVSVLAAGRLI
jgi:hypothetical protein